MSDDPGERDYSFLDEWDDAAAPRPEGLDVERLARALEPAFGPSYFPGLTDVTIFGKTPREIAEGIAAEYARLSDTGGDGGMTDREALRAMFLHLLTTDSATKDRRRKEFNQAIFNAEAGWAIWSSTDLDMVMEKFDEACRVVAEAKQ